MTILWLDDPCCQNPLLSGGKAAQLARLQNDWPVPSGFCLTTAAYQAWELAGRPPSLPPQLRDALVEAYSRLVAQGTTPQVAIRSSAVGEDGASASFAGQYATRLDVADEGQLEEAVLHCWGATHSPHARAYRAQHGAAPTQLALLIQILVEADIALVAFSLDPLTGDRAHLTIEAVRGLGPGLVEGRLTPQRYTVNRQGRLLAHQPTPQQQQLGLVGGSLQSLPVPAKQRDQVLLQTAQLQQIAGCLTALEIATGAPVDVEAAFTADQFHLFQCRPVTAAGPPKAPPTTAPASSPPSAIEWDCPQDAESTWLLDGGPVKPLARSYQLYYNQGFRRVAREMGRKTAAQHRGRTQDLLYHQGHPYRRLRPPSDTLSPARREQVQRRAEAEVARRWHQEWMPSFQRRAESLRDLALGTVPHDELSNALLQALSLYTDFGHMHGHICDTSYNALERLANWYVQHFGADDESRAYILLQGQANLSTQIAHDLWRLSGQLSGADRKALEAGHWRHLGEPVKSAFAEFRHRNFVRDPDRMATFIRLYAAHQVPDPLLEVERLAEEGRTFTDQVRANLPPEKRRDFDQVLELARAHHPLTEDHNYWLDQWGGPFVRLICDEFGRRMVRQGILAKRVEVQFLRVDELINWGFGAADALKPRIKARKADYEAARQLQPPPFLGTPPAKEAHEAAGEDRYWGPGQPLPADPGQLRGVGASTGVARGPARVARSLKGALALRPGEILVCHEAWPDWTPLFGLAAGLVTDWGGALSHPAILAREYRLPAVVGTGKGSKRIKTGQLVEVDGKAGVVRLLDSATA